MKSENVVSSEPTERRRHRSQARPQSQGSGMPGKGTATVAFYRFVFVASTE